MDRVQLVRHWREMRESVKAEWGQLTDHELAGISGDYDLLVAAIHQHTGKPAEEISRRLDELGKKFAA
ncbi:MAG TPA: CsbD family protein [bacterium]|nr:CsbD family protein [bacterium]